MKLKHKNLSVFYLDEKNVVHFGFGGKYPKKISGTHLLAQKVVSLLYTLPGSNYFEPSSGTNLYNIIQKGYLPGEEDLLKIDFKNIFETIEEQIKDEQDNISDLPFSERLSSVDLISVNYVKNERFWKIIVKIKSMAGNSLTFKLES